MPLELASTAAARARLGNFDLRIRDKTAMYGSIRLIQAHPAGVMKRIIGNALLPEVRKAN